MNLWSAQGVSRRIWMFGVGGYIVVLVGLRLLAETVFLDSYRRLEAVDVRASVLHVQEALLVEYDELQGLAGDWAASNESWDLVAGRNQDFVQTNTRDRIFEKLQLNLMLFVDAKGTVIYSKAYDLARSRPVIPSDSMLTSILSDGPLVDRHEVGVADLRLVESPEGLMLIASHPITTADGEGPANGTLVLGRVVDTRALEALSRTTTSEVRLLRVDDAAVPEAVRTAVNTGSAITVAPLNDRTVLGWATLGVLPSHTPLVLRVGLPRSIVLQGRATAWNVFGSLAMIALFLDMGLCLLLERLVQSLLDREATERRYCDFVAQSSEGILVVDAETGEVVEANRAVAMLLGHRCGDLVGGSLPQLLPLMAPHLERARRLGGASRQVELGTIEHLRPDGRPIQVELGASGMAWRGRDMLCVVARDVTERELAGARDRHHAYHDALTGLPNRLLFQDRLSQALRQTARCGGCAGVVFVDLDHFKLVNDTFGHDVADLLLVDVARRIQGALRETDSVARQGGDEFLVLLPGLSDAGQARTLCEVLLGALREPFRLDGREVRVTASVGVAVYPGDGADATTLVKHADLAMYQSKHAGRDAIRAFDRSMHDEVVRIADIRSRLTHALERGELSLHYQPQVRIASGRLVGLEALLRWDPPEGSVPPSRFVPVAEESGLIVAIGEFVLRAACGQAMEWHGRSLPEARVAVNLSARQFQDGNLPALVRRVLDDTHLPPHLLELEVTESIAMRDPEQARTMLAALKDMGVTLALDDFGTGYSSLAYLRLFPFDRLKIDRSFLPLDRCDRSDVAIVDAIVTLSHALGLEVVAEGVEIAEQLALLTADNCDLVQGFGVCPPLAAEAAGSVLAQRGSLLAALGKRPTVIDISAHDLAIAVA